jgi:cell division protein FtsL
LSQLELENQRLKMERSKLEYAEARLLDAAHLQEIANRQGLDAPSPERTVYLTPKDEKSLALNRQ